MAEGLQETKRSGVVALFLGFLNLAAFSFLSYLELPLLRFIFPILFLWVLPFLISYRVEGRDASALGLSLRSERFSLYLLYTLLGFILTTLLLCMEFHLRICFAGEPLGEVLRVEEDLVTGLLFQIGGIGLPEEVFFRGFLMGRLCNWLGEEEGLVLSSLLFGMGHVTSRLCQIGLDYALSATIIGVYAFLNGLIFGYQYLNTGSVLPSAATHISLNLFGARIVNAILL